MRSVMAGDHLREEEHMALETLLANVPQNRAVKSNSLELTPSNTPQLSPATTPANKKNRLPIGILGPSFLLPLLTCERTRLAQSGETPPSLPTEEKSDILPN